MVRRVIGGEALGMTHSSYITALKRDSGSQILKENGGPSEDGIVAHTGSSFNTPPEGYEAPDALSLLRELYDAGMITGEAGKEGAGLDAKSERQFVAAGGDDTSALLDEVRQLLGIDDEEPEEPEEDFDAATSGGFKPPPDYGKEE